MTFKVTKVTFNSEFSDTNLCLCYCILRIIVSGKTSVCDVTKGTDIYLSWCFYQVSGRTLSSVSVPPPEITSRSFDICFLQKREK